MHSKRITSLANAAIGLLNSENLLLHKIGETLLIVGVTSDLIKRVYKHKDDSITGFTARYNCKLLVYYELLDTMYDAISRGKQIKGGSRINKLKLIENMNPS